MKKRISKLFPVLLLILLLPGFAYPQTISWLSIPDGYIGASIDLSEPFTFSIAPSNDPDVIYVSVGKYFANKIIKVNLTTEENIDVTEAVFGSIGGMTTLPNGDLIIIDNDENSSSTLPGECIIIAKDLNNDGDFKDPGEINKLLDPILVESLWGGFTGSQARTVPAGNPSGIPSGSVMFQDADSLNNGDLFVVTNPTTNTIASYRPLNSSYFNGFDYNGGFDFDSKGMIYSGTTTNEFHGTVYALSNINMNEKIDAGEFNDIVTTGSLFYSGVTDLVIDKEDDILFTANTYPNPAILTFRSPADPLNIQINPSVFAAISANWISAIRINSKTLDFEPDISNGAVIIISGYAVGWQSAKNILILKPKDISSVDNWNLFK